MNERCAIACKLNGQLCAVPGLVAPIREAAQDAVAVAELADQAARQDLGVAEAAAAELGMQVEFLDNDTPLGDVAELFADLNLASQDLDAARQRAYEARDAVSGTSVVERIDWQLSTAAAGSTALLGACNRGPTRSGPNQGSCQAPAPARYAAERALFEATRKPPAWSGGWPFGEATTE